MTMCAGENEITTKVFVDVDRSLRLTWLNTPEFPIKHLTL